MATVSDAIADKLAIRELFETYADAVIRRDAADWGATWAADARWEISGTSYDGRAAIVARWRERVAEFDWIMFRVAIGRITVTGHDATARSYTTETFGLPGGSRRETFGRYDDDLVREDDGWRFRRRRFAVVA